MHGSGSMSRPQSTCRRPLPQCGSQERAPSAGWRSLEVTPTPLPVSVAQWICTGDFHLESPEQSLVPTVRSLLRLLTVGEDCVARIHCASSGLEFSGADGFGEKSGLSFGKEIA